MGDFRVRGVRRRFMARRAVLALLLATLPADLVDAASPAGSDELSALIMELGNGSYARRTDASSRLLAAGPRAVKPLLNAMLNKDREIVWRARQVLIRLAETSNEAYDLIDSEGRKESETATVAQRIAGLESVVGAQRKRSIERVKTLIVPAREAIKRNRWKLAQSRMDAAEKLARKLGVYDECEELFLDHYVKVLSRTTGDLRTPQAVPQKLRKRLAQRYICRAIEAMNKSDLVTARRLTLQAKKLDVLYSKFEPSPDYILHRIEVLSSSAGKTSQ